MFSTRFFLARASVCTALLLATSAFARSGDTLYGTVTDVASGNVLTLDYGQGQYTVRLIGIDVPGDTGFGAKAKDRLASVVKGKYVRFRFDYRNDTEEMVGRIFSLEDPAAAHDLGEILVREGLMRRQHDYDYKCGCLLKAENEARAKKSGIWGASK